MIIQDNSSCDLGIPLDSVVEVDEETGAVVVIAYEQGGTFSKNGLNHIANGMQTFKAFSEDYDYDGEIVVIRATGVKAAITCLQNKYVGKWRLYVETMTFVDKV
jgi:hypothetical protein